ncbi:quinolinate synthetase [Alkalithermobacter thermoalcaliphilus JW-YL-7 = DSM 7308]|uniref:Quinolinate synthase n=1 Tax=Alkalithermobacter thermoalcaliphilus JW-YL-7 = DSM 7308 TaxID=1121328 RepID=A0A150FUC1_CLOPD|nr:quinolinate synthetase complex, A subunit [[Clostridium] paradoxum JW-YL-7 = DSM 7308]SHL28829.1 quinolinate synthetase [[Clostridium] paradoxum JW-YL-7 = DSM 7308]
MNNDIVIKEIEKIKKENNIKIFAHNYQNYEVQQVADYIGDSFYLTKLAREIDAQTIIMCGVDFMAETIKILSPDKKVILPVKEATCPMANMIKAKDIENFKKENNDFAVVAYINTSADVKAVADICVTSSNAVKVIESLEENNILFVPDINLGNYISKMVKSKNIISWNGYCPIHDKVTKQEVINMKNKYPNAPVLVHPECRQEVIEVSDFVGSTSEIIEYASKLDAKEITIGTETGTLHVLRRLNPGKKFRLLSNNLICINMKKTTLEDVYNAVVGNSGYEVKVQEDIRVKAKNSLERMIELAR